jgi:hypothetical protein
MFFELSMVSEQAIKGKQLFVVSLAREKNWRMRNQIRTPLFCLFDVERPVH